MPQAPSTRWCPTPEQLMILEEMYRSGVRTPNASQIQQITSHLSYYGKIEGKNVFYWFQNHKARDRQKLRRRLSRHQQLLQQHQLINGQPHLQIFQRELPYLPLHSHQFPFLQAPSQFLQQGVYVESNPVMNLVYKQQERYGREAEMERSVCLKERMPIVGTDAAVPPCCRSLKTLDLFPIKSTCSLKEECRTFNSSFSSSMSTTTS